MKICIAGATGFIGQELVPMLLESNHQLTVLGRSRLKIEKEYAGSVVAMDWETLKQSPAEALRPFEAVINLSGASVGEKYWTAKRRNEIFSSRIEATSTLAQACADIQEQGQAISLLNASAIGIYPFYELLQPEADNENQASKEAHSFLQTVSIGWESACESAVAANCRVVKLRFGNILEPSGGILQKLLPPYRLGLGAVMGAGTQPFPWISRTDACQAIKWILENQSIKGPINLVAPERITQRTFSRALSKHIHRPHFLHIPGKLLKAVLGDMATELVLTGPDVSCQKLVDSGFIFKHKNITSLLT